jgi:hypothetical protein
MESIASLEASAAVWEFWGYVATGAVFIGALIESIVTFWPHAVKNETAKERVGKGASLLLIAGVAGELLTQVRSNLLNERVIALINRESAQLEAVIAPRRLSADQQQTASTKWKRFAGDNVAVE